MEILPDMWLREPFGESLMELEEVKRLLLRIRVDHSPMERKALDEAITLIDTEQEYRRKVKMACGHQKGEE